MINPGNHRPFSIDLWCHDVKTLRGPFPAVLGNSPYEMIGDRGNVGIIRSLVRASILPDSN